MTDGDCKRLEAITRTIDCEKPIVVEIGSWKGHSTSIIGKVVKEKGGIVYAIDHWMGNDGTWNKEIVKEYDVYSIFMRNMELLKLTDVVKPIKMASAEALKNFLPSSVDMIFFDGDHTYKAFKKEIHSWYRIIKDRGILCGHDCEKKYTSLSLLQKLSLRINIGRDYISGIGHPGVILALYKMFEDRYELSPDSIIWWRRN